MAGRLSALDIFREASLRSGLVTGAQWKAVAREALDAEPALRDPALRESASPEQTSPESATAASPVQPAVESDPVSSDPAAIACDRISDALIQRGVLTRYQAQQLRAGRTKLTLGNYRITSWLGQGGMGQVFGGVHEIMGRRCAIKVLPLEKATDTSRESFIREIRLQASLDCPYLVRAFDAGRDGNVHYLVTEFVDGQDLRELVREHGPLSMQQAASIVAQAAAGLAYAHQSGLVHRDVKPANILVTHDGHAKVSDVGLAALTGAAQGDVRLDDPQAGKIVGTADYLSPEQIRTPLDVGPASDIYALGCTLYFAVTGKVPFPGGDTRSKCRRHLTETPLHPRRYATDLSDAFIDTIADMMEKDVAHRIGSATDVVERLAPWAAADIAEWSGLSGVGLLSSPRNGSAADGRPASDPGWLTELGLDLPSGVTRSSSPWQTTDPSSDTSESDATINLDVAATHPGSAVGSSPSGFRRSGSGSGVSVRRGPAASASFPPPPGHSDAVAAELTAAAALNPPPVPPPPPLADPPRRGISVVLWMVSVSLTATIMFAAGWLLSRSFP